MARSRRAGSGGRGVQLDREQTRGHPSEGDFNALIGEAARDLADYPRPKARRGGTEAGTVEEVLDKAETRAQGDGAHTRRAGFECQSAALTQDAAIGKDAYA